MRHIFHSEQWLPYPVELVFDFFANILFNIGLAICSSAGVQTVHNPSIWIVRGLAWLVTPATLA